MQKKRKCPRCGTDYWVRMLKVYVFKRRICPKCKKNMFSDNTKKIHECKKCGLKVKFDDDRKLAEMGVQMKGASTDSSVARKMRAQGYEVIKSLQPSKRLCQRCRNFRNRIEGIIKQKKKLSKKQIKEISDDEMHDIFFREIQQKLRAEQERTKKAEKLRNKAMEFKSKKKGRKKK